MHSVRNGGKMRTKLIGIILALLVVVVLNLNCGMCGRVPQKIKMKGAEGEDIEVSGSGDILTGAQAQEYLSRIPAEFRYPGSNVRGGITVGTQEGSGSSVVLVTNDPVDNVVSFYKSNPVRYGWMNAMTTSSQGQTSLIFSKGEQKGVVVNVGADDEGNFNTMIVVTSGIQ